MQFGGQAKPPVGVIFDSAMGNTIDDPLALALLYGLQGKNESRVVGVSTSKPSLSSAEFCDVLVRFYTGEPGPFGAALPIGLNTRGKDTGDSPMIAAVLGKPYPRTIHRLNDTADPVADIRNALSAQFDQNAIVVMTGPATNLAGLLALPEGKELIARKVRHLAIAPWHGPTAPWDAASAAKLFAEWPTPILAAPKEVGDQLLFPAAALAKEFAWAAAHPIVDAWHGLQETPQDAPSWSVTAALYAIRPSEKYFTLSEPGNISASADGRTQFTPAAGGRHHSLVFDPAQKERVLQAYVELASTKPVPRRGRRGG
jgi:hypothetical protein